MKRRDVLKLTGAAALGSLAAACAKDTAPKATQVPEGPGGEFTVLFHGPGLLQIPPSGASAAMHFVAVPYSTVCPQPVHLPRLYFNPGRVHCPVATCEQDFLMVAGLEIEPVMEGAFSAQDYTTAPEIGPGKPSFPQSPDEWSSLRWVPILNQPVSPQKIREHRTAKVSMPSGRLHGHEPNYDEAKNALFVRATETEWSQLESSPAHAAPHAMTDQVILRGRYTGGAAVLRVRSLLNPTAPFELMLFRPKTAGGAINLKIAAEPPDGGHTAHSRPVEMYCQFYDLVEGNPPVKAARALPYLWTHSFQMNPPATVPLPAKNIGGKVQPSPKPECGSFRVALNGNI